VLKICKHNLQWKFRVSVGMCEVETGSVHSNNMSQAHVVTITTPPPNEMRS
jgi:hypothetical protein